MPFAGSILWPFLFLPCQGIAGKTHRFPWAQWDFDISQLRNKVPPMMATSRRFRGWKGEGGRARLLSGHKLSTHEARHTITTFDRLLHDENYVQMLLHSHYRFLPREFGWQGWQSAGTTGVNPTCFSTAELCRDRTALAHFNLWIFPKMGDGWKNTALH